MHPIPFTLARRAVLVAALFFMSAAAPLDAATFTYGDLVRLNRSETLLFQGQNLAPATKGQEFSVLKLDPRLNVVYVGFLKPDGTLIAVTLPPDALEPSPPNPWAELLRGAEAYRDGRLEDARRAWLTVGQDPAYKSLAGNLMPRLTGLTAALQQGPAGRAGVTAVVTGLRAIAGQLAGQGLYSVALALEEGSDRFAPPAGAPPATGGLEREDLKKRATTSSRAMVRCRQAMALHRMMEASKYLAEGLAAEPARPDLLAFQVKVKKDLQEALENYENADKMRRFQGGAPHALTALEHGLKACTDFPALRKLRSEMQGQVEARTAPPVTPELIAAAKVQTPREAAEEGHKLYTTRCTECHDLELLDSRSLTGWEKAVGGMAGRAHLNDAQRTRIMDYLTLAWNGVSNEK